MYIVCNYDPSKRLHSSLQKNSLLRKLPVLPEQKKNFGNENIVRDKLHNLKSKMGWKSF